MEQGLSRMDVRADDLKASEPMIGRIFNLQRRDGLIFDHHSAFERPGAR